MQACYDHARDLLDAAKVVQSSGKPHIAYHLAALALEELGRRELTALNAVASATTPVPPAWPSKHTLDHVQKMFWAFFGAMFRTQKITKEAVEEIRSFANYIHARRIAGLYVDTSAGLSIPSEAMSAPESENLIRLVEARLGIASTEEHRPEASREDIDIQNWFLVATEDDEKRKLIFSDASMTKLAELGNARAWIEWLKNEFDAAQAQARETLKKELERIPSGEGTGAKPKYKMRLRLFSASHSVRPKALKFWNDGVASIKLMPVPENKRELVVELLFGDNVHVSRLWDVGWITARRLVAALNLGTRGFWWWHVPRQVDRYYDRIDDLENGMEVKAILKTALKIDWGQRLVLDEGALRQSMIEMIVVTRLFGTPTWVAVEYYLGGLTFLSLNEIHWPCETQALGNFLLCLKTAMRTYGGWCEPEPFEAVVSRLLSKMAPTMPVEQHDRYVAIVRAYEAETSESAGVNLGDVGLFKVLCDSYFASVVAPAVLKDMEARAEEEGGPTVSV